MSEKSTLNIRPASATDETLIKEMVKGAQLDTTTLDWKNFVIGEIEGEVVGIGQLKIYRTCREIKSLVVKKGYRKQGIARQIMEYLEAQTEYPIHLMCLDKLEAFYKQFGYERIGVRDSPREIGVKLVFSFAFRLLGYRVIAMKKEEDARAPSVAT